MPSTSSDSKYDINAGDVYFIGPSRAPQDRAPAGEYKFGNRPMMGWYLQTSPAAPIDDYVPLPNPASEEALQLINSFVNGEYKQSFEEMGLVHKMALLMWGPPGTSKSVTVYEIKKYAVSKDWVVIDATGYDPDVVAHVLRNIRTREPQRQVLVVMEEFDSTCDRYEEELLQLLDGNNQFADVVYLFTTNHITEIPDRLFLRYRRIPFQVEFKLPDEACRRAYFEAKIPAAKLRKIKMSDWLKYTEGFTLDQCAQTIINVFAFKKTLAQVKAELELRKKALGQ